MAFSAMLITGALGQPWVGKISDRAGRRPVVVLGTLTAAMAMTLLIFQPSLWIMLSAMFVAVAALDVIRAAILAGAVDLAGHNEGSTLGLAFIMMDGIGALGAVLAGIAAGFSWPHMFGLAAALSLCASALATVTVFGLGGFRHYRSRQAH
jgi:MFS family permease